MRREINCCKKICEAQKVNLRVILAFSVTFNTFYMYTYIYLYYTHNTYKKLPITLCVIVAILVIISTFPIQSRCYARIHCACTI